MAMCKECGGVFGIEDMEDGICKSCRASNKQKATSTNEKEAINVETSEESSVELNTEAEKVGILSKLFSFQGKIGRLDYLLYGLIIPIVLMGVGFWASLSLQLAPAVIIAIILAIPIQIAATVKRARDRGDNPILIVILSLIPYLGFITMLYLLLAPSTKNGNKSKIITYLLIAIAIIFILGILAAIAIPKLSQAGNEEARRDLACLKMAGLSNHLKLYKLDHSTYPSQERGFDELLEGYNSFGKPYIKAYPKDSWGNSFEYIKTDTGFDIVSYGADGKKSKNSKSDDMYFSECKK